MMINFFLHKVSVLSITLAMVGMTALADTAKSPDFSITTEDTNQSGSSTQEDNDSIVIQKNRPLTDLDFRGKGVSTANLDWKDSAALTAFLKANVKGISDEYTFKYTDTYLTDIKGFKHYDCYEQKNGVDMPGYELIVHTDAQDNVLFITGMVGDKIGMTLLEYESLEQQDDDDETQENNDAMQSQVKGSANESQAQSTGAELCTTKADITGDLYYYKKGHYEKPTFGGAIDSNGNYVLQDPGRIYTLDYSGAPKFFENLKNLTTVDALMSYGKNFTSSSATFSDGYKSKVIKIDSIKYDDMSKIAVSDKHFTLTIKRFLLDEYNADVTTAWQSKGDTLVSMGADMMDDGSLLFDLSGKSVTFDMPSREQDPDATIEKYIYFFEIKHSNLSSLRKYLKITSMSDLCIQSFYTNNGEKYKTSQTISTNLLQVQPALDVHWGLERCLDVYKETFGIDGYNGRGGSVAALVNYLEDDNCSYSMQNTDDGCAIMTFGLGGVSPQWDEENKQYFCEIQYPLTCIEVMGHEYTHAVAWKMNCVEEESMALNESYADIMGLMIRRKSLDNDYHYTTFGKDVNYVDWWIGNISGSGDPQSVDRHLDDPSLDGSPIYYKGEVWNTKPNIDAHDKAGVQTRWFYLMCTGGDITPEKGEKVSITAIPRDSAELIAFSSLMYFGMRYTDYALARRNSIDVTRMYFGDDSQELETVYKAWYAVGVGTDEWQPGEPTAVDAIACNEKLTVGNGVVKAIKNGRLIIQKNGKAYNAAGAIIGKD